MGIPSTSDPNGSFLEKEFLSKEVSGRKIEIDEVVEPLIPLDGGAGQGETSIVATPVEEEVNDHYHKLPLQLV